jgi:hypothetical protein
VVEVLELEVNIELVDVELVEVELVEDELVVVAAAVLEVVVLISTGVKRCANIPKSLPSCV